MNKLKVLSLAGGGIVTSGTVMLATAGAFAATPSVSSAIVEPTATVAPATPTIPHTIKLQKGTIASVLGMTPEQLKSELQSGKTLDDVAQEHGMTKEQVMTQALKKSGFSDDQIQKVLAAMANGMGKHRVFIR